MGYRSEVVLAVSKEMLPHFLVTFARSEGIRSMVLRDHDHLDQDYGDEGGWMIHWADIKWYESYPEVQILNEFIDNCDGDCLEGWDEEKHGSVYEHFRFVRLGEDFDDVAQKGEFCWSDIHLNRAISF